MDDLAEPLWRVITELADSHVNAMRGMMERENAKYVKRVIDDATVVFGVFPNASEPRGVGMQIIKGRQHLQTAIASKEAQPLNINAVPCINLEQAAAAAEVWGDGQIKNN